LPEKNKKNKRGLIMKKRLVSKVLVFCLVLLLTLSLGLVGCSSQTAVPAAKTPADNGEKAQSVEKISLRLASMYDTKTPLHKGLEQFVKEVSEKTNGNIEITVYPDGVLGGAKDNVQGVQLGTIDMSLVPALNLVDLYPELYITSLPFMFPDSEHAYKVVDGPIMQEQYKLLQEKTGIVNIGNMMTTGFRLISNNVRPVLTPDDMKGIKMRVMETPLSISTFKELGAICSPMPMTDVFTGLQQKTVDGQDSPLVNLISYGWHKVQKYVTLSNHQWNGQMVIINENAWNKIPADYQNIIIEAEKNAVDAERKAAAEMDIGYIETCKEAGVEVIELTPEQTKPFKGKMMPVWQQFEEKIGKDLIDKVDKAVNES